MTISSSYYGGLIMEVLLSGRVLNLNFWVCTRGGQVEMRMRVAMPSFLS